MAVEPKLTMEVLDRVITEPVAAEMMGISADTLRRMVVRGEGPPRIHSQCAGSAIA
jgi:hypothetical protein